jgi:hypothetical protein
MAYEVIEFARHREVKIGTGLAIAQIKRLSHCWIGLSEIGEAACDFPLVFLKDETTGRFRLVALMGFAPHRNLFVLGDNFVATYLPSQMARAPFALTKNEEGDLVGALDADHPRAKDLAGAALFDQAGNETPYLTAMRAKLTALAQDQAATLAFIEALAQAGLLAPVLIDLNPRGETANPVRLDGLYTISRSKLRELCEAAIVEMHHSGYLAAANTITNSLAQVVRLQQLHNAHAKAQIAARPEGDQSFVELESVIVGLSG